MTLGAEHRVLGHGGREAHIFSERENLKILSSFFSLRGNLPSRNSRNVTCGKRRNQFIKIMSISIEFSDKGAKAEIGRLSWKRSNIRNPSPCKPNEDSSCRIFGTCSCSLLLSKSNRVSLVGRIICIKEADCISFGLLNERNHWTKACFHTFPLTCLLANAAEKSVPFSRFKAFNISLFLGSE